MINTCTMRIHQLQEQPESSDLDLNVLSQEVQALNQRFAQLFGDQPLSEDQTDWTPIIAELKRRLKTTSKTDYHTIDSVMKDLCNEWSCDVHKLHDQFVDIEGQTPDDWIKSHKFGS